MKREVWNVGVKASILPKTRFIWRSLIHGSSYMLVSSTPVWPRKWACREGKIEYVTRLLVFLLTRDEFRRLAIAPSHPPACSTVIYHRMADAQSFGSIAISIGWRWNVELFGGVLPGFHPLLRSMIDCFHIYIYPIDLTVRDFVLARGVWLYRAFYTQNRTYPMFRNHEFSSWLHTHLFHMCMKSSYTYERVGILHLKFYNVQTETNLMFYWWVNLHGHSSRRGY